MEKSKSATPDFSVREFFKRFPDDETCLKHIFDVRFGERHVCRACGVESTFHRMSDRRAFACAACGDHVYPTAGTIFQDTRTPLQLWFYALYLFTTTRHGVSGKELQRQLGVTYKTAWRIANRLRKHIAMVDGDDPLGGFDKIVEVDETYVGGHKKGAKGRQTTNKTVVFGMVERGGEAVMKVVPNVKKKTLHAHIAENVEKGTEIHADEWVAYDGLEKKGYSLKRINKDRDGSYVGPNGESVNTIENFWRHLKCSIKGTHVSVSPKYLEAYAKEFEYRFNRRMRPETMLGELLSRFPELDAS